MVKYREFRYTEVNLNYISWYKDNLDSQNNSIFYYLSNETNTRFVTITVLEL